MQKEKKWVIAFLCCMMLGFAGVMTLIIIIDPFFQYHKPLKGFPYVVDNQLSQNPGMAKNMEYDSVILGSSLTVNFDTDWFRELEGLNTIKLNYNGAYPKDQSNIMKIIFENNREVKKVFMGIDMPAYTSGVEETKYPIQEHLYDSNYLNDINYLLNKDVVINYILKAVVDQKDKTDLSEVYKTWWTDEYFKKELVLKDYEAPEVRTEEADSAIYLEALEKNLSQNICPYIEENPDTEFVLFFTPYSILYWYGTEREQLTDTILAEFSYTIDRLLEYENVSLYMFSDQEWIITDLDLYADYCHYHTDINRYMAECFVSGECEVTQENKKDRIRSLEKIAKEYDYNLIFEK